MKIFAKILFPFLAVFFSVLIWSCEPDDPDDDTTDARLKFISSWTCVEESQLTYTVDITASPTNSSEVFLANFHHLGESEKAIGSIAGYAITIPEQPMCSGEWIVKGSGMMGANEKTISFQYTVAGGPTTDTINATYTKP
jgi:hypothetical protein